MCVGIDDFMHTLRAVEDLSSLNQISTYCVASALEDRFFRVSSFWGGTLKTLRAPFAFCGKTHKKTIENTLKKTKKVFLDFLQYLANPQKKPSRLTLSICSLCHSPEWVIRLAHMHKLMRFKLKMPVRVAARLSAPVAFEQLTAMDVPWETLQRVLVNKKIDLLDEIELTPWVKAIEEQMSKLPSELLLGTFRQVSCNLRPNNSEKEWSDDAFFLVLLLNARYENLFLKDNLFVESVLERLRKKMPVAKEKLNIEFSKKIQISAYSLSQQPPRSVLVSSRPLMLCALQCYLLRQKNTFPLLAVYDRGDEGEFLIVEGLVGSLDTINWGQEKGVSPSNQLLADSFVDIVKRLLGLDITPQLDLKKFLVTTDSKICVTDQLDRKHEFLSIPDIENFIKEVCRNDQARISYVMRQSKFFADKYAVIFPKVLKTLQEVSNEKRDDDLKRSILSRDVLGVLYSNDLYSDDLSQHVVEYLTKAILCLKKADKACKGEVPVGRLINAIIDLQQEIGFVTSIPDNLEASVVQKIKKEKPLQPKKPQKATYKLRRRAELLPVPKEKERVLKVTKAPQLKRRSVVPLSSKSSVEKKEPASSQQHEEIVVLPQKEPSPPIPAQQPVSQPVVENSQTESVFNRIARRLGERFEKFSSK